MKKLFMVALLLVGSLSLIGCGPSHEEVCIQTAKGLAEIIIAKQQVEERKSHLTYHMEGEIECVKISEKKIEDLDPDHIVKKKDTQVGNLVLSFRVQIGERTVQVTRITFADGREKEFMGLSPAPLVKGKYYDLAYNGLNEIESVTEKK